MRPKPPADVAISILTELEERSWRFLRPKPPADVAISMSESETLKQTKSFNEVEESRRNSMK